jgi:hypothetical protein
LTALESMYLDKLELAFFKNFQCTGLSSDTLRGKYWNVPKLMEHLNSGKINKRLYVHFYPITGTAKLGGIQRTREVAISQGCVY